MKYEVIFDLDKKGEDLEQLEKQSADPDFWNDSQVAQRVTQQISRLQDEVEGYNEIGGLLEDLQVLIELAIEEGEESLAEEIEGNLRQVTDQINQLELKIMLAGEHDHSNAIINIRPGAGGTESQDWARMLMRMYLRWCERQNYKTETLELTPAEEAGIKSVTILVSGDPAFGYLQAEAGIHRLVRISPFDFNNRRHTSFASLSVTPEIDDDIGVEISPGDIRIDFYRAGGAGGQHVNTTDSAVRITHEPTGIVAQCQNERSQHKNRELAMKVLRSRLYEHYQAEQRREMEKLQGVRPDINFGSQIRSYVMHPYRLVKDARTEIETGNVDAVLDGNLNTFIEAYLKLKQKN